MDFKQYIRTLRKQRNIPVKKVLEALGISISTFNRLENETARPHPDFLRTFATALEGDYLYMLELLGYVDKPREKSESSPDKVPIIPWTMLSALTSMEYESLSHLAKEKIATSTQLPNLVALRIPGNQWAPYYQQGDVLFVQITEKVEDETPLLILEKVIQKSGKSVLEANIRRVKKIEGAFHLVSLSPFDQPEYLSLKEKDISIIGKIVRLERQLNH